MIFDAEAYAEGICNSAAGSSIEVLVDHIDSTISMLTTHAEDMDAPDGQEERDERAELERLADQWGELRAAIVELESGEGTVFGEEGEA
jgi:hypothetical protein